MLFIFPMCCSYFCRLQRNSEPVKKRILVNSIKVVYLSIFVLRGKMCAYPSSAKALCCAPCELFVALSCDASRHGLFIPMGGSRMDTRHNLPFIFPTDPSVKSMIKKTNGRPQDGHKEQPSDKSGASL